MRSKRLSFTYKKPLRKWKDELLTIGSIPPPYMLYVDFDSKDYDIYDTEHGFHLIVNAKTKFDHHLKKIRIAPKFNSKGKMVNPAPKLIFCHCPKGKHVDKRLKGKLTMYNTGSN